MVIIIWVVSWTFLIPDLLIELYLYVRNGFITNIAEPSIWLLSTIVNTCRLIRGIIIPIRNNHGENVANLSV